MNADHVERIVQQITESAQIPGMSVAVAGPEGILYAGAVGYADLLQHREANADDQYLWFSMTKIATATAVMRLHADGRIDLDAPIGKYLSGYRPSAKHGHPTTRQLLTHTAGLSNPIPIRWVRTEHSVEDPALIGGILEKHGSPKRAVGGKAAYSNIGYLLAGQVIEAVTGETTQDWVTQAVLAPLDMTTTGYRYSADASRSVGYVRSPRVASPILRMVLPEGIIGKRVDGYTSLSSFFVSGAAYGGLVGNVTDAAKLGAAHAAGPSDAHPLLDHEHIVAMRTITAPGRPFDHGIGWFRKPADAHRGPGFVEHYGTGLGYWNALRIYPKSRLAMVAMTNTTFKWDVDKLFTRLHELSWS